MRNQISYFIFVILRGKQKVRVIKIKILNDLGKSGNVS